MPKFSTQQGFAGAKVGKANTFTTEGGEKPGKSEGTNGRQNRGRRS